jgi:hypothetical protein
MTTFVYCLGILLCGIAGFIDRNPSVWRFIAVMTFFSGGILLMTFTNKIV